MAKSANQKLKMLYLKKILLEKTDDEHAITMPEIIKELESCGVKAERKSIYDDIECLKAYGMDIVGCQENRSYYYHVASRPFELAELKLLVDTVQSAKFITKKKSDELIKKIEGMASVYEASKLHRQVYVSQRVKTMNESIYNNVDLINEAIAENKRISFIYFKWSADKKQVPKNDGKLYYASPWALCWNDENYYLIAYDSDSSKLKHYRVDKMKRISLLDEKRDMGGDAYKDFDMALYTSRVFGMYGGKDENVTIECRNDMAGVIIDRFGKDIIMIRSDDEHFRVNVKVAVSPQFLGWITALGDGAKIIGPPSVLNAMNQEISRLIKQYRPEA